jgi:hypothetical protein
MPLAYHPLDGVRSDLQDACLAVNKNQLGSAKTLLIAVLRALLLVAVSTDAEANEVISPMAQIATLILMKFLSGET